MARRRNVRVAKRVQQEEMRVRKRKRASEVDLFKAEHRRLLQQSSLEAG
jgi:hypothetical protein